MKSHIWTHNKRTREQIPDTTAQAQPMFQSRSFVVQSQSAQKSQPPDLKTSLMRAEHYGHHPRKKQQTGFSTELGEQEWMTNESSKTEPIQKQDKKRKRSDSQSEESGAVKKQKMGKQKTLEEKTKEKIKDNPDKVPTEVVNESTPNELVGKKDPFLAGDHSPSLTNLNNATDGRVNITGRAHSKGKTIEPNTFVEAQDKVPTLHFSKNGKNLGERNLENYELDAKRRNGTLSKEEEEKINKESESDGAKGHTELTSIRAAAGVGEHARLETDELLDRTMDGYRGRDRYEEYDIQEDEHGEKWSKGKKVTGREGTKLRVDVRNPGTKENDSPSLVRHPVHPRIGQGVINRFYRQKMAEAERRGKDSDRPN